MKIGDDSNYLEIEPAPDAGTPGIFSVRAHYADSLSGCDFSNAGIVFSVLETTLTALERFESLADHSFRASTGGDGFIELVRSRRGAISFCYRFPTFEAVAYIEGRVEVQGEYSMSLVGEIRRILMAR